jgi:hypothetical protein
MHRRVKLQNHWFRKIRARFDQAGAMERIFGSMKQVVLDVSAWPALSSNLPACKEVGTSIKLGLWVGRKSFQSPRGRNNYV